MLRKGSLVALHPFVTRHACCVRPVLRNVRRHMGDGTPPAAPAWGIRTPARLRPGWCQRKGEIKQRLWWYGTESVWDAVRSTPGASLPRGDRRGETSKMPALVRHRLSATREEKLHGKVCLYPHLEQGGMPPVERGRWLPFFSLTDGS